MKTPGFISKKKFHFDEDEDDLIIDDGEDNRLTMKSKTQKY